MSTTYVISILRAQLDNGLTPDECRAALGNVAYDYAARALERNRREWESAPTQVRARLGDFFRLCIITRQRGLDLGDLISGVHRANRLTAGGYAYKVPRQCIHCGRMVRKSPCGQCERRGVAR